MYIRKGLLVIKEVNNELIGKLFRVEYRISPKEVYTGKAPRVYDYIKTWGYKVIIYIVRESLPGRQDKFIIISI